MDPDLVYARSAKGEEEIRTRQHQLRPLHRQSLILVDGQSPLKVLLSRWAALRGFEEAMAVRMPRSRASRRTDSAEANTCTPSCFNSSVK